LRKLQPEVRAKIQADHPIITLLQQLVVVACAVIGLCLVAINQETKAIAIILLGIMLQAQFWGWDE
jgi:hypothetical protein